MRAFKNTLLSCLFGFSLPLSTMATAAEIKYQDVTPAIELQRQDLLRYVDPDNVLDLLAGEQGFIAVKHEQTTPFTRGVAVMLANWSLNQMQTGAFKYLNESLTEHGWVTIAAGSHEADIDFQINDTNRQTYLEQAHSTNQQLMAEQMQAQQLALQMRLRAIDNEASSYSGISMLVVQGVTAGLVVELLADGKINEPEVLVLIQPYFPDAKANKKLAQSIASLDVAILDIWSDYDNPWSLSTVDNRRKYARKMLTMHYRQRQLFGDMGWEQRDARLTKEIVGYIAYLGW